MQQQDKWRNRIVGYGEEKPENLAANPCNVRLHNWTQQDMMHGVLVDVGWVQDVIVNRLTGLIVDGHMRVALALRHDQQWVPVTYVELTEQEEKLVLATFDAVANMASLDTERAREAMEKANSTNPQVQELLADVAVRAGVIDETSSDNDGLLNPQPGREAGGKKKQTTVHRIQIRNKVVPMTDEEKERWDALLAEYEEEHGSPDGIFAKLLGIDPVVDESESDD